MAINSISTSSREFVLYSFVHLDRRLSRRRQGCHNRGWRMHKGSCFCLTTCCNNKPRWAIVRPLAIGLIGLALAVVLWGIGYKLSLYRPHPGPSVRMSVAKLWVGLRKAACVRSAHTRLATLISPDPQLLHVWNRTTSYNTDALLESSAASPLSVRFRIPLGTLRSPPTRYL